MVLRNVAVHQQNQTDSNIFKLSELWCVEFPGFLCKSSLHHCHNSDGGGGAVNHLSRRLQQRMVLIVSRTLSGLFLVGAFDRPRKKKRMNRENPRTKLGKSPDQSGKIPTKSRKQKGPKRTKPGQMSPDQESPRERRDM